MNYGEKKMKYKMEIEVEDKQILIDLWYMITDKFKEDTVATITFNAPALNIIKEYVVSME